MPLNGVSSIPIIGVNAGRANAWDRETPKRREPDPFLPLLRETEILASDEFIRGAPPQAMVSPVIRSPQDLLRQSIHKFIF